MMCTPSEHENEAMSLDKPEIQGSRVIVTGGDSNYYELLSGAVSSVLQFRDLNVTMVVLDFGLAVHQSSGLEAQGVRIVGREEMMTTVGMSAKLSILDTAMLVRTEIPKLVPGFDVYMWLDGDAWIQWPWAAAEYFEGAASADIVVAKERHPEYRCQPRLRLWEWKYLTRAFGLATGTYLSLRPHVNAGVFAAAGDSPIWSCWSECLKAIFERMGKVAPYDQMALHACVYSKSIRSDIKDARYNWICDRQRPMLEIPSRNLCVPGARNEALGIVHLAGVSKQIDCILRASDGTKRSVNMKYPLTVLENAETL